MKEKFERRILGEPLTIEWRDLEDGTREAVVEGYAARFNRDSLDLGGFVETIKPGAFRKALQRNDLDVLAVVNHDSRSSSALLGRTKSGTLQIKEDSLGLRYRVKLPDTAGARDLVVQMERGDIQHSSFAFSVREDSWKRPETKGGVYRRTIVEVEQLFDVSPVTQPAYPDATAGLVRSLSVVGWALESRAAFEKQRLMVEAAKAKAAISERN